MGDAPPPTPSDWVKPSAVMNARKLRAKRHALQARMNTSTNPLCIKVQRKKEVPAIEARLNPFR